MNLKKNIFKVFSANFIQLISNAIIGFIIPAVVSVPEYANYKTFSLLIGYLGLLHFGFPDALFLKYGGFSFDGMNKSDLKGEFSFFLKVEFFVSVVLLLISLVFKNKILFLLSFTIIPYMIMNFFKSIYQSIAKFDRYTHIMYTYTISFCLLNIILALLFRTQSFIFYSSVYLFANIFAALVALFEIRNDFSLKKKCEKKTTEYFSLYKSGFVILIANLAVMLFYGLDRWFVKFFLTSYDFAYYSFAVNLVNIFTTLVSAVSVTFYSYLFEKKAKDSINNTKNLLLMVGTFSSGGFFIIVFIVSMFLQKYLPSIDIIKILFANFPLIIIINVLYINLYKIKKQENKYFKVVILMLLISFIYNLISILIYKSTSFIAIATLMSFVTWFFYSSIFVKDVKILWSDYLYLFIMIISFLLLANYHFFISFIAYYFIFIVFSFIFYKKTIVNFIKSLHINL